MKVNQEMVEYWYGSDIVLPKDVIRDIIDLANGDYKIQTLKTDILNTWDINQEKNK
tara:strand:- start:300 stop:467 length:168 start_codon:yes stop_codon:yes gene_type:complete